MALPSGQVCALSRTLPCGVPGWIPGASKAKSFLPLLSTGGVPGTPCLSRGRARTGLLLVTPVTAIRLGVKATLGGFVQSTLGLVTLCGAEGAIDAVPVGMVGGAETVG